MPAPVIRTVLFDLDGTLADTAPDMAQALNRLLAENGQTPLAYELIRSQASFGGKALIKLAFELDPETDEFEVLRQRFLVLYQEGLCEQTTLFEGIPRVLDHIAEAGLNWGIVTNKPAYLTDPLVEQLGLKDRAITVVSGDTTQNAKPHPQPLLHACTQAGSQPHQCLFVGDARRDIEAGHNANMQTLVARFGYLRADDRPEEWGADGLIDSPAEIIDWLKQHA